MKILFIDPQSSSNLAQYDYLLLKGIKHKIIYCCNISYDADQLEFVDYRFVFKYNRYRNNICRGYSYIISLLKVFRIIVKESPDVIHIQWIKLWLFDFLFLSIIKSIFNLKVVYTAHNVLPHDSESRYMSKMKRYYHKVDSIITHTQVSKRELIELFSLHEGKINVMPHGLFQFGGDKRKLAETKSSIISELNLENKLVFSVLGFQNKYKGIDLVKKVWKYLSKFDYFQNIQLIIIGKNDKIDFSDILRYKNVFIREDFVSSVDFQAYLEISNVLLLPYIKISQSGVLLSAIGSEIPFVVSDAGGLSEPLSIADVGWCIGKANFDNLLNCVVQIITTPSDIEKKKNNIQGWEKLQKYYSWDSISKKTVDVYFA